MYVINHAAFFVSHRLPLALGAIERGHDVILATGRAGSELMEPGAENVLKAHGVRHVRVAFTASGLNPFIELRGLFQLIQLMSKQRPDVVHCASPKGNLYGGLAARLTRRPALVIAVSGMGFAFSSEPGRSMVRSLAASIFRLVARFAYGHSNKKIIVQNTEDQRQTLEATLATPDEVVLIPGSGVDVRRLSRFTAARKSEMVLFAARMVREKGVLEFAEAARIVRSSIPTWRFVMAGAADYRNPSSVAAETLERYQAEGVIEWHGLVEDMDPLFESASIVCLPSYYREGIPKFLIEAAAASCAVVTTDLPGCREAIINGVTGDLVPARDPRALAECLSALILDPARREQYGIQGRRLAAERYDIRAVVAQVNDIYDSLVSAAESA
jgi:glycosyltransferase involved in cell wall biosynthesis